MVLMRAQTRFFRYIKSSLLTGLLVVVPVYVAALLLQKAMSSLATVIRPVAKLLPEWIHAGEIISFLILVLACLIVGIFVGMPKGRSIQQGIEKRLLQKIPGYTSIRALTDRLAGDSHGESWEPALVEIENALVPAFIIETLDDGRFTVFVPSVPTPLAGTVYILTADRVHPVDIPFTHAIKMVAQWGAGAKEFIAAMDQRPSSGIRRTIDGV